MKRSVLAVLAGVLVAACGGGGGNQSAPPPPPTGTLRLVNSSSYNMDETYVVPSSASSWGSNLGSVSSGSTVSMALPVGSWDLKAVSYGTTSKYYTGYTGANIVAGSTFQLTAYDSSYTGSMQVFNNNATYTLTGLYVVYSPNGGSWGSNWLTAGLAYGGSFTLSGMPTSYTYDVECVWAGRTPSTSIGTGYSVGSHAITTVNCN
jgi:hypothetical protein